MSDYTPDTGSRSSLLGNQGGAGVQAPIWSDDPSKKTITNQNAVAVISLRRIRRIGARIILDLSDSGRIWE